MRLGSGGVRHRDHVIPRIRNATASQRQKMDGEVETYTALPYFLGPRRRVLEYAHDRIPRPQTGASVASCGVLSLERRANDCTWGLRTNSHGPTVFAVRYPAQETMETIGYSRDHIQPVRARSKDIKKSIDTP